MTKKRKRRFPKAKKLIGGIPKTQPRKVKGKTGRWYKKGKKWHRQDLARDRKRKAKRVRGSSWASHTGDRRGKRT